MMDIKIKKMETDEEIRGKAFVHWKSWHEAFTRLIENKYIDGLTIEKCEEWAFRWPENTLVAKDGERVVGFVCYGDRGDEAPGYGEIFALYVLSEYYGKGISSKLICKIYLTIREVQYIICIVRREALEKLENEVQTH